MAYPVTDELITECRAALIAEVHACQKIQDHVNLVLSPKADRLKAELEVARKEGPWPKPRQRSRTEKELRIALQLRPVLDELRVCALKLQLLVQYIKELEFTLKELLECQNLKND